MVARQEGATAGILAAARFASSEAAKIPVTIARRLAGYRSPGYPTMYSDAIVASLEALGHLRTQHLDIEQYERHVKDFQYPANYAAGSLVEGGSREQKILEYFASLQLLDIKHGDTVIDVASEWSVFPQMVRQLIGATVYRQDLVYPPGVNGDRIGGDAAAMPVPAGFADHLVLHNSFEHFEGESDTGFILESWRVLKPGGKVCVVPLFVSERYLILSDPLVRRKGLRVDPGAELVDLPWWHNRFGRLYDAPALQRRVLQPAREAGFIVDLWHFANVKQLHPRAVLYFGLSLEKPASKASLQT